MYALGDAMMPNPCKLKREPLNRQRTGVDHLTSSWTGISIEVSTKYDDSGSILWLKRLMFQLASIH